MAKITPTGYRIEVISPGSLPKGLALADLGHKSIRRNAIIADLLHRIEFIEKGGTGIWRIRDEARELDCPEPEFEADSFVTVILRSNTEVQAVSGVDRVVREATPEVTAQFTGIIRLLQAISGEMSRRSLQEALDQRNRNHFHNIYLLPALRAGLIEMTIPDKPRSSKQRYRLTLAGSDYLKQNREAR